MIFFKHCYYRNPHQWGVLGLPDNRASCGDFAAYKPGTYVALAQDIAGKGEYAGQIFAICTLLHMIGRTKDYGNPAEITNEDYKRWPECLVIHQLAFIVPKPYRDFGNGALSMEAQSHGRFFQISCGDEVKEWLQTQKLEPIPNIYRSPQAGKAIEQFPAYKINPFPNSV